MKKISLKIGKNLVEQYIDDYKESYIDYDETIQSWKSSVTYSMHDNANEGLRSAQLGAIFAIRSYWTVQFEPATIIMPTGTGKTETIITTLIAEQCNKTLIVVPSKLLHKQTVEKCLVMGILKKIKVISAEAVNPIVGSLLTTPKTLEELTEILEKSHIIVTTMSLLQQFSERYISQINSLCTHLIIDEAHHIPAKTWNEIKYSLLSLHCLQFTATPFRNDGKRIDGNIIYNFPLSKAQEQEYFQPIDFYPIYEYCAEGLLPIHKKRTETFSKTYTKANSQNLKEIMDLFESLEEYIDPTKFEEIMKYIKNDTPDDIVSAVLKKIHTELELLVSRFDAIINFGKKQIAIADISNLDSQIKNMEIPRNLLEFFGGKKVNSIIDKINDNVKTLQSEIAILKKDMGALKGLIQATIVDSQKDINEFLKTAGINYELVIKAEDESNSKTILQQCYSVNKTEVEDIRNRLSWGEKNAFSLILFMYYAQSQNPDLIILDDPVSSFDSNKKFAILHRMLKKDIGKKDVSLSGKTVLLLTHDFEPITDFIIVGKLSEDVATSSYIWNFSETLSEEVINPEMDVKLISVEAKEIARNENINIVSRIAFLRKYCELHNKEGAAGCAYEIRRKVGNDKYKDMSPNEMIEGKEFIFKFIPNFNYDNLIENTYTEDGIKKLYNEEQNSYFKIQLFRALSEISKKVKVAPLENAWYKFIDETYHIENDYLHYLDLVKFNIVPSYISNIVDGIMETI